MRIFFDTNFLVNLIIETEFTEKTKRIVEEYISKFLVIVSCYPTML